MTKTVGEKEVEKYDLLIFVRECLARVPEQEFYDLCVTWHRELAPGGRLRVKLGRFRRRLSIQRWELQSLLENFQAVVDGVKK